MDADISHLLPYINASVDNSAYYENSQSIQFRLNGIRCAIYPDMVHAAQFEEREEAERFIEELIAFLNDMNERKDLIEPDYTPFKQVPVLEIFKLLPRTNCKECGYATCMAFAAALSKGNAGIPACPELNDGDNENTEKMHCLLY